MTISIKKDLIQALQTTIEYCQTENKKINSLSTTGSDVDRFEQARFHDKIRSLSAQLVKDTTRLIVSTRPGQLSRDTVRMAARFQQSLISLISLIASFPRSQGKSCKQRLNKKAQELLCRVEKCFGVLMRFVEIDHEEQNFDGDDEALSQEMLQTVGAVIENLEQFVLEPTTNKDTVLQLIRYLVGMVDDVSGELDDLVKSGELEYYDDETDDFDHYGQETNNEEEEDEDDEDEDYSEEDESQTRHHDEETQTEVEIVEHINIQDGSAFTSYQQETSRSIQFYHGTASPSDPNSDPDEAGDNNQDVENLQELCTKMLSFRRTLTEEEKMVAGKCEKLVTMVSILLRKIAARCVQEHDFKTEEEIKWLDELADCAVELPAVTDDFGICCHPPQCPQALAKNARSFATTVYSLYDLVNCRITAEHSEWFNSWHTQFQLRLESILDHSPLR